MRTGLILTFLAVLIGGCGSAGQQGAGVVVTGEPLQWHKVTLTLDGPEASEEGTAPNPFLDYRMTVTFTHESGAPAYSVPGYFAADGDAAESSATSGNKWRAHFSPDRTGRWDYQIAFLSGSGVAVAAESADGAERLAPYDGLRGSVAIGASDKVGRDFRAHGRLAYVDQRYLQFAGSGEYFLKVGADSPETLLGYADFDNTIAGKPAVPLKSYDAHVADWTEGDPIWKDGRGKGLIGAFNYLAGKGVNAVSFLPYNAGGDGDNVWPFISRDDKFHYDASKLDQWQIVFDHAQALGLYLHFKLQETEIDDNVRGNVGGAGRGGGRGAQSTAPRGPVVESFDGGDLGVERRLYLREMIARFGYLLALNWNLGEENTQTPEQQRAMAGYIDTLDPYDHLRVIHTYPNMQEAVYPELLGDRSALTGASLQNGWDTVHERTLRWIRASEEAGRPWVVANDEQGPASLGVPPDLQYQGFDGTTAQGEQMTYDLHDVRKLTLWGNLMAGGAGVEYYFGYQLLQNDLVAEDFRSRDKSWDFGRIALGFFRDHAIPFWEMENADALVGNPDHDNSRFCLAKEGELYLVYAPDGGSADLDLSHATGRFDVRWFDPRNGGELMSGAVSDVQAGGTVSLGTPPNSPTEDWLIVVGRG